MNGPFTFEELPKHAVLTRRFGVKQSSTLSDGSKVLKFRPIDDYSESLINVTNACDETIQPMGVDQICAALVKRMRIQPGCDLVCKTIDLRKAYKNLPISETALGDAYIAVYSPDAGVPLAFQTKVLPFGARAAVMGFCRTSYAIWRIGVVIFGLHWTVYFDDYFLVAEVHESKHVDMAQQLLFMILNWQTSDEKEGGFSCLARILGVQIDLADARLGVAVVSNVERRVKELVASIDDILGRGTLSSAEMKVLRGRLVFAEAQIFGPLTGIHMKQLSRFEHLVGGTQIDEELKRSLLFLRDRVLNAEPRRLLADIGCVYHLYTDACFEAGGGGLAGVLFDGHGSMLSFFSEVMSVGAMEHVNPLKKKGVIFELETLATALGAFYLMPSPAIRPCDRMVIFLDNESSLARLVSGSGSLSPDNLLFSAILQWEFDVRAVCWYERVASHANVADDPSRGKFDHFDASLRVRVDPEAFLRNLTSDVVAGD